MKRLSKAEQLLREDVNWLTGDRRGMRIVARLMRETAYFDPPFGGNVERLNFHAGRRHAGHWLFNLIVATTPDRLLACVEELSQASHARPGSDPDPGTDAGPESDTAD
jgi:hypothetical protein